MTAERAAGRATFASNVPVDEDPSAAVALRMCRYLRRVSEPARDKRIGYEQVPPTDSASFNYFYPRWLVNNERDIKLKFSYWLEA